jgi:membrane dipeptidase
MPPASGNVETEARRLAHQHLLVDGHIDLPHRLHLFDEDPSGPTVGGDFDAPRAKDGGLSAAFMALYLPSELQETPGAAPQRADALLDRVERMATQSPDVFALATSPAEVRSIARTDAIALLLGMENGAGVGDDLTTLHHFYDRGVRYLTLTHDAHNLIGDSSYGDAEPRWGGLSPFGNEVVDEMNRLGMMVDVSHVTDETAWEVLDRTSAPVIASHSGCRRFTPGWERNLSDALIEGVAETDGVVMIPFGSPFLRAPYRDQDDPIEDAVEAYVDAMGWAENSKQAVTYEQKMRRLHPIGTVADVANHIDHVVDLAGVDHVGLGSDFDGVFAFPEGLRDVSQYPNLIAELLRREYSEEALRKILGENVLRVWSEVETAAEKHRKIES